MMLFQVTYTMLPGQRDAFLQMMRSPGSWTRSAGRRGAWTTATTSRRRRTGTLLLVERWTGPEAQKAHMATSHMARAGPGQGPVCGGDQRGHLGAGLSADRENMQ